METRWPFGVVLRVTIFLCLCGIFQQYIFDKSSRFATDANGFAFLLACGPSNILVLIEREAFGMNIRNKLLRTVATYIAMFLFSLVLVGLVQAQPKLPSAKDIDALNTELKKLPTPGQQNELNAILDRFSKGFDKIGLDMERYGDRIEKLGGMPGYPFSGKDIQDCISIHKRTKELFFGTVDEFSKWGVRSSRPSCTRQAAIHKAFFEKGSAFFMSYINALPLGTAGERAASALWVVLYAGFGGPGSLVPDIDARLKYSAEMLGLYTTCLGGAEYAPGTE